MFFQKKNDYRVKLKGRSRVEYIENRKRIIIDSEFLAGNAGIVLYSSSLTHLEPPHQNEILSDSDLSRIRSNVLTDLAKHNIKAEWD